MFEEVFHVAGELLGILQERKVADARLDQKRRLRNMVCHVKRVLALDRFVMISVHDPGRYANRCKLRRREMGFDGSHPRNLRHEILVATRRG